MTEHSGTLLLTHTPGARESSTRKPCQNFCRLQDYWCRNLQMCNVRMSLRNLSLVRSVYFRKQCLGPATIFTWRPIGLIQSVFEFLTKSVFPIPWQRRCSLKTEVRGSPCCMWWTRSSASFVVIFWATNCGRKKRFWVGQTTPFRHHSFQLFCAWEREIFQFQRHAFLQFLTIWGKDNALIQYVPSGTPTPNAVPFWSLKEKMAKAPLYSPLSMFCFL